MGYFFEKIPDFFIETDRNMVYFKKNSLFWKKNGWYYI